MMKREAYLDEIRGCIFGGAVGDALGYPVEFLDLTGICESYGPYGITEYEFDRRTGKALISDDTQMTLFTANGYLVGETRTALRGIAAKPSYYIAKAYADWYVTQMEPQRNGCCTGDDSGRISWLLDVPQLYNRRAPGLTCMSALQMPGRTEESEFIGAPVNNSKGCGGVMRVAPLAVVPWEDICELDKEAAQAAAITHSHPLGYLPAAVLCHIIQRIIYPVEYPVDLKKIVLEAKETVCRLYMDTKYVSQLASILELAVELAENDDADTFNIRRLGGGWVGEEALAIAVYCALRYEGNFSAGLIAAVNHDGDSDSTGAIAGNILGALAGYQAIDSMWKEDLELADVILEIADDLCCGCNGMEDAAWIQKYCPGRKN